MGTGIFGLFGGDSDADGHIDDTDKISFWELFVGKSGYNTSDYNLNGQINNPDKNDVWEMNKGETSQLP